MLLIYRKEYIIKKKDKRYIEKINKLISNKNIDKNSSLYSNLASQIAKEISSPLSMYLAPISELNSPDVSPIIAKSVEIAYRNLISIQTKTKIISEIDKLKGNSNNLIISDYYPGEVGNYILNSFDTFINANTISVFYFKKDNYEVKMWVDIEKIKLVFSIILLNAYRHINYNGTIWIKIDEEKLNDNDYYTYSIKDDGLVFSEIIEFNSFDNAEFNWNQMENKEWSIGIKIIDDIITKHKGGLIIKKDKHGFHEYIVYLLKGKWQSDINIIKANKVKDLESFKIDYPKVSGKMKNDYDSIFDIKKSENTRKKIVVIEDHKELRLYYQLLLEKSYSVITAKDGKEGIRLVTSEKPDIVISDVLLPNINGIEICSILKSKDATSNIPIIMVSAVNEESYIMNCLNNGADDYILKPFNPKILLLKIKKYISKGYEDTEVTMDSESIFKNDIDLSNPFISKVIEYINNGISDSQFNVMKLASYMNMSQPTLYRYIKKYTEYNIVQLIKFIRLKKSMTLLKSGKYTINEVSENVGYNDIQTFKRNFVEYYHVNPASIIRNNKAVS